MDRRHFLRTAAIIAAGVVAADQLELLERLAPRRLFPAWPTPPRLWGDGLHDDTAALQYLIEQAAAGGGDVKLPGGNYRITSTLHVYRPGIVVDGNCSRIMCANVEPALHIHNDPDHPVAVQNWWLDNRGGRPIDYGVKIGGKPGGLLWLDRHDWRDAIAS